MRYNSKLFSLILALMILTGTVFAVPASALADSDGEGFVYQHDPTANPYAMKDIVQDDDAVYGFRPSETGSLKQYAGMDWSDSDAVAQGREERIAYHESIAAMYETLAQMEDEGKSPEEIARAMSKMRNDIRIASYKDDPEGLAKMKERNLEKYGHEEGPLPEELYKQYGSWEKVTEKAFSANVGMDACLGLYDDYYFLYVALGQVGEDASSDIRIFGDADGDEKVTALDATCIQRKLAKLTTAKFIEETADADGDGAVTIIDATTIQRWLAQLPSNDNIGKPIA